MAPSVGWVWPAVADPNRPREPLPTRVDGLPELPHGYHEAVEAGLRDLAIELTPAARTAVDGHVRLLLAWTAAINLTAIRDPIDVALLHVIDSLAGLAALGSASPERILDLGSGGGYPGIPLAVALPAAQVVLVDSIAKKVTFLETAIHAIGLSGRVRPVAARAEALAVDREHRVAYDVVVVRAVAPLAELVELAMPLLATGGRLVAWKRGSIEDELTTARGAVASLGGGAVEVTPIGAAGLVDHLLVTVHKVGPTPSGFPRDPSTRRRHPL